MTTENSDSTSTLVSTYALDQLKRFAASSSELLFAQTLLPVFAANTPVASLRRLKEALMSGTLANPGYRVANLEAAITTYDSETRTIVVDRTTVEQALEQADGTPALLIALIEGFGLHIDAVLREDFEELEGAEPAMEEVQPEFASRYAAIMTYFDRVPENGETFANYTSAQYDGPLSLTLPPLEDAPAPPEQARRRKRFAAEAEDLESHAHETIGKTALTRVGFNDDQCLAIYFGNWLRDYSQLIDPKVIRRPEATPKFPALFTRQALTKLVDWMALKKFHSLQTDPQGRQDYTVTPELLGVYRPSQHIDNPINLDEDPLDPRTVDAEFEPLVFRDDPLNSIDPEHWTMSYFKPGVSYMMDRLDAAKTAGMTATGMRNLGEALHVLEDLFAHSNYAELCLRKAGYADVATWSVDLIGARHPCPVVTGRFSGLDVIGSLAEPLARILFPTESLAFRPIDEHERSENERALLILLDDTNVPEIAQAFKFTLDQRDIAAKNPLFNQVRAALWVRDLPLNAISYAKNWLMQKLASWAGDQMGTLQVALDSDPNVDESAIVTHSQLAKDHATHPLHDLAALLAHDAVERVARAVKESWDGNNQRVPSHLASSYFVHPNDTGWHDSIVKQWAQANPDKIEEACSPTRLMQRRREELEASLRRLQSLGNDDNFTVIKYSETLRTLLPIS